MKNSSSLFALFFVALLTLAGCSAGTISGPELAPADDVTVQEDARQDKASHNDGAAKNGGGGDSTTRTGASHN